MDFYHQAKIDKIMLQRCRRHQTLRKGDQVMVTQEDEQKVRGTLLEKPSSFIGDFKVEVEDEVLILSVDDLRIIE